MRMPERTFQRTFLNKVFIRNAESFWQTSLTLTFPLSFIVGVGNHYVTSRSHVLPCWFRRFTPTCMDSIPVPLFHTYVRDMPIVVTPELVSDVLRVLRVEHPNYPECEHLRTMSKDEMIVSFASVLLIGVIINLHHVRPLLKVLDL